MSSSLARAQEEPALTWQAPAACPSREAWLSSLRARVEPAAWRDAVPKLRAAVRVEAAAQGYALQLDTELAGAKGQRRLEGASCAQLVEASALIVALAIDPNAAARAAQSVPIVVPESTMPASAPITAEATPPVEPAATPARSRAAAPEPERAPVPAKPVPPPKRAVPPVPPRGADDERPPPYAPAQAQSSSRFFVRTLAVFDSATLPKLAVGPVLQGSMRFGRLSLELGAAYLLAQSLQDPETGRAIGELRWLGGSAGACYELMRPGRLGVAPCGRMELGWLWGRGRNLEQENVSGGATWLAFAPGVLLAFEVVRGFSVDAELGAALPLLPSAFTVSGVGELHATPAVAARLAIGLALHF